MNGRPSQLVKIFEHPLNERIRLFLRLENLFNQFSFYFHHEESWDSWAAIATFINLQNLIDLSDIKSEVLRELERQSNHLIELQQSSQIDDVAFGKLMSQINFHTKELLGVPGRLGQQLRSNEFLSTVRQRLAIPGGTCNFDAPAFNFWLALSPGERKASMSSWAADFSFLKTAVFLILDLIRGNITRSEEITTKKNFFSTILESMIPTYQMVQVVLTSHDRIFPEISGGRQRVSIRFLTLDASQRILQVEQDVQFIFRCCS